MQTPRKAPVDPAATPAERIWRNTFFLLSATLGALALVQFEAGRLANGLGDAGAAVLMLSLMTQYPFVRAVIRASAEDDGSPERAKRRHEELTKQAAQLKAAHPLADIAGRAGWILLGISLVLRLTGVS
jgi:hypothetical protein